MHPNRFFASASASANKYRPIELPNLDPTLTVGYLGMIDTNASQVVSDTYKLDEFWLTSSDSGAGFTLMAFKFDMSGENPVLIKEVSIPSGTSFSYVDGVDFMVHPTEEILFTIGNSNESGNTTVTSWDVSGTGAMLNEYRPYVTNTGMDNTYKNHFSENVAEFRVLTRGGTTSGPHNYTSWGSRWGGSSIQNLGGSTSFTWPNSIAQVTISKVTTQGGGMWRDKVTDAWHWSTEVTGTFNPVTHSIPNGSASQAIVWADPWQYNTAFWFENDILKGQSAYGARNIIDLATLATSGLGVPMIKATKLKDGYVLLSWIDDSGIQKCVVVEVKPSTAPNTDPAKIQEFTFTESSGRLQRVQSLPPIKAIYHRSTKRLFFPFSHNGGVLPDIGFFKVTILV